MPLEFLGRTQSAIEALQVATPLIEKYLRQASQAIDDLPQELRPQVISEIKSLFSEWPIMDQPDYDDDEEEDQLNTLPVGQKVGIPVPNLGAMLGASAAQLQAKSQPSGAPLLSVSSAIVKFLADSPTGVSADKIVAGVRNTIRTKSVNPDRLIRSTISQLRLSGRLRATKDGCHFLTEEFPMDLENQAD